MLKKTITYTDYNGEKRTEDFYFNLSRAEVIEMNFTETGSLRQFLDKIIKENNQKKLYELFKEVIMRAYGEKTEDGKRFVKSREMSEAFTQTEAFSELVMEFFNSPNATAASDFINAIIPKQSENLAKPILQQNAM